MSETRQYTVKIRSTYEHVMTVDVDMDDYNGWNQEAPGTIQEYIESEIDYGDSIVIPSAEDGQFCAYDLVGVEPIEPPAKPSEESL